MEIQTYSSIQYNELIKELKDKNTKLLYTEKRVRELLRENLELRAIIGALQGDSFTDSESEGGTTEEEEQ